MSARMRPNLLVMSDLHLGEDLRPMTTPLSYLRRAAKLERELEAFLAHYTDSRLEGRPWRLVVNGDMVDFMSVMILPGEGGSADEKQFGLAFGERQTVEKLDRVFERHPGVFQRLGEFVAAGNELIIVVGNHDVEFRFPAVQRRFVEQLERIVPGSAEPGGGAIRFCPWFYYEEERVYVEHGHQYDEYCSFDYQLHPVDDDGGVALSIAHAGIRYFTNLVPSIDPVVAETWVFVDYLRWASAHGARAMARLCFLYAVFVWKALSWWSSLTNRVSEAARAEKHQAALGRLGEELQIAAEQLRALDELRCVPVIKRLGRTMKTLFLDRLLVGGAGVALTAVALWALPGWLRVCGVAAVWTAGAAANWLLGRGRVVSSHVALRRAPEAIRAILRAPFVVFGHSHYAERVPLSGGGVYFNTGAWSQEDATAAFTHLLITGDDQPHAELRQWRGGVSAPYAAPEKH